MNARGGSSADRDNKSIQATFHLDDDSITCEHSRRFTDTSRARHNQVLAVSVQFSYLREPGLDSGDAFRSASIFSRKDLMAPSR